MFRHQLQLVKTFMLDGSILIQRQVADIFIVVLLGIMFNTHQLVLQRHQHQQLVPQPQRLPQARPQRVQLRHRVHQVHRVHQLLFTK